MLNSLKELKDVKPLHYALGLSTIMATIAPGFLCLMLFKPALIQSLDVIKIIIASFSLTMPLTVMNFVFLIGFDIFDKKDANDIMTKLWTLTSFLSSVVLYLGLYFAYLCNMSFRNFAFLTLFIETAVLLVGHIMRKSHKKEKVAEEAPKTLDE